MKVTTNMERSTVPGLSNGQMAPCILENFITITFTERESILGQMVENTKVNGEIIRCTEKVHFLGLTEENTSVSMLMIKSKAMVNSYGLMVVAIKVTGREESSMEKVFMSPVRAMKNMENGKTGRESVGLERKAENNEIDFFFESCIYYIILS